MDRFGCYIVLAGRDKDKLFFELLWIDRILQFENENKCCKSPKNLRTVNIKVPTQALILSNKRVN